MRQWGGSGGVVHDVEKRKGVDLSRFETPFLFWTFCFSDTLVHISSSEPAWSTLLFRFGPERLICISTALDRKITITGIGGLDFGRYRYR